jgi:hypothetical protein
MTTLQPLIVEMTVAQNIIRAKYISVVQIKNTDFLTKLLRPNRWLRYSVYLIIVITESRLGDV